MSFSISATKCECSGGGCSPDEEDAGICYLKPGGYCFAHMEFDEGEKFWKTGCFPPDVEGLLQVSFSSFLLNFKFLKFKFLCSVRAA